MAVSTRGLGLSPGLTNWEELIRGWNHFERIPDVYVPFHPHILSGEADKAGGGARGEGLHFLGYLTKGFSEKLPLSSLLKNLPPHCPMELSVITEIVYSSAVQYGHH